MMGWRVVDGMPEQPNCCAACGGNPADFEGNQQKTLWAEGVDIDWGNMLYLCWDCVNIIASFSGRATKEGFDKLEAKYNKLKEEHAALLETHAEMEETVRQIRQGAAARRKLKAEAA